MAIVIGGSIAAAGAIGGAAISSSASKSAANTQADAANNAAQIQQQQWEQTQANLKPYMDLGSSYINPLKDALSNPTLTQQFSAPTAAEAQATPGYQFTLNQGLKATQNSAAARGLGTSGAALKGASSYATGLADSTYNDVYNRALQTFQTNYNTASNNVNRLQSVVSNGQNAAATNGSLGAASAGNIGNTLTSGANASAAGTIGSSNALSGALNSVGSSALTYGLLNNNASSAVAANPTYGTTAAGNPNYFTV
jgi:hypothetical protein